MSFCADYENILYSLDGFFVENAKNARALLKKFDFSQLRSKPMILYNKYTRDFTEHLKVLTRGEHWGILSEAGLSCIADPGSRLVSLAHQEGIEVEAMVGPSSLIMGLMLSGFYSQTFTFHGYFPRIIDKNIRKKGLHIYIERPFHNAKTIQALFEVLHDRDELCIAANITAPDQRVVSCSLQELKTKNLSFFLQKKPVIYLLHIS